MTLTSPKAIATLTKRLRDAAPCRGVTLVLPAKPGPALEVPADQIARVIAKVYATANPEHRITVEVTPGWDRLLACDPSDCGQATHILCRFHGSCANRTPGRGLGTDETCSRFSPGQGQATTGRQRRTDVWFHWV